MRVSGLSTVTGEYLVELLQPDQSHDGALEQTRAFMHGGWQAICLTSREWPGVSPRQFSGYPYSRWHCQVSVFQLSNQFLSVESRLSAETATTSTPSPSYKADPTVVTDLSDKPGPEPPTALQVRLIPEERVTIQRSWNYLPSHARRMVFRSSRRWLGTR